MIRKKSRSAILNCSKPNQDTLTSTAHPELRFATLTKRAASLCRHSRKALRSFHYTLFVPGQPCSTAYAYLVSQCIFSACSS